MGVRLSVKELRTVQKRKKLICLEMDGFEQTFAIMLCGSYNEHNYIRQHSLFIKT